METRPIPTATRPTSGSSRACRWISALFREVQARRQPWLPPHSAVSPQGEIIFEWRNGAQLLTVYVGGQTIEFVRAWGADLDAAMLEGDADTPESRQQLWSWLLAAT